MDGLDDFEKQLAADKAEREKAERDKDDRRQKKHSHHHRHRDHDSSRHRHKDGDDRHRSHRSHRDEHDDGHRHKRRRRSPDQGTTSSSSRPRAEDDESYMKTRNTHEELPIPDDEKPLARDSWMTDPSAIGVDYKHRKPERQPSPPKEEPKRVVHKRELNSHLEDLNAGKALSEIDTGATAVEYNFGDAGSKWRMTKLRGVYTTAEESGRHVEEVAMDKYGSLAEFDAAREEKEEMERRRIYGEGIDAKHKPSGDLHRERMAVAKKHTQSAATAASPEQGTIIPEDPHPPPSMDQTALNRLRAQMMKAKLRKAPNAAQLEQEYNEAAKSFAAKPSEVVLSAMHNRQLAGTRGEVKAVTNKRGLERGTVQENTDMTIEDMVREERRTKHQAGGEGMRLAERIAKDGKFDDDLEYMDENAEKLARRVHKSEVNLKNMAVGEFQKMNRILETCPLCHHEDKGSGPVAAVVSLATRTYLTLPTEPEVSPGGAVVVPTTHRRNLLECDDDEWEEIRNFMKSLTRMYHDQGREVLFYENAANPARHLHAALIAVPIPYEEGATAPAYFREAVLASAPEWSQHRKLIDTAKASTEGGLGKMAFRNSLPKEMGYFHVWFSLDGGLGHVVEDEGQWPRGDLFAREVLGGIVDADVTVVRKQGRWRREDGRVEGWKRGWRKFDWTRVLA